MKKKALSVVLSLAIAGTLLAGCGGSGSSSQPASIDITTGINSTEAATPVECQYYNLQGIRLNGAAKGLNIVTMRMSDGKTVSKVISVK